MHQLHEPFLQWGKTVAFTGGGFFCADHRDRGWIIRDAEEPVWAYSKCLYKTGSFGRLMLPVSYR